MKLVLLLLALQAPRFDVAAIKPDVPGGVSTGDFQFLPGGRLFAQRVLLRYFIQNAYGVRPFQISGGPDWINSEGYDIEAKADGDPSPELMQQMMQTLLEDRFKLRVHREVKELPVYELTAAKGEFKLRASNEASCLLPDPGSTPVPDRCGRALVRISRMGGAQILGGKISMAELIRVLSNVMGRTVIDKTGFTETFDLNLSFALDDAIAGLPRPPVPEEGNPSIFVAMPAELGLKLGSARGPVEVLVIDHVERASGN